MLAWVGDHPTALIFGHFREQLLCVMLPADKEEQKDNVQLLQRYCVLYYYVRHTCRNS
jgi:hypothetical protein